MIEPEQQLAVLGSPIAHSKSPALHEAAYAELGLPWRYRAIDVTEPQLSGFVEKLDDSWRGLSLTMPLKRTVLPLLGAMDRFTELTGGANTVLLDGNHLHGFNTDVFGVTGALRSAGIDQVGSARILGGGATAASVVVALHEIGAGRVAIAVRNPDRVGALVALCETLEVELSVETLGAYEPGFASDLVVSTLPNGTELGAVPSALTAAPLFDVAYDPWPSSLAAQWIGAGSPVVAGLEMLAWQALAQVRVFVNGHPTAELEREARVFSAMRAAVGLPA